MQTITTQALKQKLDNNEDFVFLNVLSEEQYRKEHIPGSANIPYDDEKLLEKVAQKAPGKNVEIIVYCANTECPASGNAAKKLEEAGYTNVKDYEEGMQGWKDAAYDIAA